MKKFSGEFLFAFAMLLMSFVVFEIVVLPNMYRTDETAAVAFTQKAKDVYRMQPSVNYPGAFTFDYAFTRTKSFRKGQTAFDMSIAPFDERSAPGITHVGNLRDTWGYPVRENAFMKSRKGSMKSDRSDEDPDVVGLVNCRADESVTGYFKAYFEDVALGNGVDYDDPAFGEARRTEACQVLQDISELLMMDSNMATPGVLFAADPGNIPANALAGASAYFPAGSDGLENGTLHDHIISGIDPTPGTGEFDAFVLTNFDAAWDVDSELNSSTYDFYTVLYHEVMHALGFRGLLPAVITSTGDQHRHGTFDAFTYENATLANPFFDPLTTDLTVPVGAPSPWFTTDNVVYRGVPNIFGALPDGTRPIFSPGSWQEGSSLSHFDMNRSGGQVYVMHPSIGTNTERSIHEHEKEVLCHLGYRVAGTDGCETSTPFAVDDIANVASTVCVNPLTNDLSLDGGTLVMQSLMPVHIETGDNTVYYSGLNCTGSIVSEPLGARSFLFTSGPSYDFRRFSYTVKNSIAHRISDPATITLAAACGGPADEYVCNGDFEMDTDPLNATMAAGLCFTEADPGVDGWDPQGTIPFWCHLIGTPDIADDSSQSLPWSLPWNCSFLYAGCNVMLADNGGTKALHFVLMKDESNFPLGYTEGGINRLRAPLVPGHHYRLSFDTYAITTAQMPELHVKAMLGNEPDSAPGTYYVPLSDVPQYPDEIMDIVPTTNPSGPDWQHVEHEFIADSEFSFLALYPTADVLGGTCTNECRTEIYFDNISLQEVTGLPESISGTVYGDSDADGIRDPGEMGLAGISVLLFDQGETAPSATAVTQDIPHLGEYAFTGLAAGTYRTVLEAESLYENVTEPVENMLVPGYAHAAVSVITDGEVSAGNDFGVTLAPAALANIHLKKSLVDATLSIVDRNITWRVEAVNGGPHAANNIHILDLTPAPLIYYAHVAEFPDTYSQNSGMWYIPHLEPGESAIIQITMKVPWGTCGTRTNTATLQSLDEIDTDPTDDTATALIKLRACGNTIESVK